MADYFRKTKSLYASTTNTFGTGTGVTITPNSVSGLPTDTEITLTFDRIDSAGTATPSAMERIIGTVSGGNFVVRTSPSTGRGADGNSDAAHTAPVVEYIPNAKDMNDAIDGLLIAHEQTGIHKSGLALPSPVITTPQINDTSSDHQYVFAVSELTADRIVTLPLLTGADEFVFKAHTQTLTNKRNTARTGTTTSSATPTINTDNVDFYSITAQTEAITSFTTNLSGTPTERQTLWIAITGTAARAITWGASFEASTVALPTTTVTTARLDVGFVWNSVSSKWRCVSTA